MFGMVDLVETFVGPSRVALNYSVATHETDPALCVRGMDTPRFRGKVYRVFTSSFNFFFLYCGIGRLRVGVKYWWVGGV